MATNDLALAILDYGYTKRDGSLRSGLEFTISLAQRAEDWGYSRFWFTEHHDRKLQIAAPEVVIAALAAHTRRIRVGSAAILLPYYSPFKVAEVFHTLANLFPDRIDLGIARGVGALPEVADLLRDGTAKPADDKASEALFERKTRELIGYLRAAHDWQQGQASASPLPGMPEIWLMGYQTFSAALAAQCGTKLAMYTRPDGADEPNPMADYAAQFQRAPGGTAAGCCILMQGICGETEAQAQRILDFARSRHGGEVYVNFCGSPERCRETILRQAARYTASEVVVSAQLCPHDQQETMFRLLAKTMLN